MNQAWVKENSVPAKEEYPEPHFVATKEPNGFGLYDMLGNVQEWATVIVPSDDNRPVTRGGSFMTSKGLVNPALRVPWRKVWQDRDPEDPKSLWWLSDGQHIGFRVVRED